MREAILGAVRSGRIEELRHAWELNELKPDLGVASVSDPIAHWKQISGDGEGREILAALAEILEAGYVVLPLGPDLENNRLYVWPYFAEVPLDKLSPAAGGRAAAPRAAGGRQGHADRPASTRTGASSSAPTARGILSAGARKSLGARHLRLLCFTLALTFRIGTHEMCRSRMCGRREIEGAGRGWGALDLQPCWCC